MGPHGKRGMGSRKKYMRIVYGGVYAVKSVDAIDEAAYRAGRPNCGFVTLQLPSPAPVKLSIPAAPPMVDDAAQVARAPIVIAQRVPVVDAVLSETIEQLADMSIRDLKKYVRELDAHDITLLLKAEQGRDKPRSGAVKLMEKALNRLTSVKE